MLSNFQRVVFGSIASTVGTVVAIFEGIAIFYYNEHLNVSLAFLGLANFAIGALAAYVALIAGNLSDRAVSKYRRKTYILIFGPLYAIGVLFRLCAFTTIKQAPWYYVITYALQVSGSTGLDVVTQAWGVELASDIMDRNQLYSISTFCGFSGIFLGVLWNKQFVIYLIASCFVYFINTLPALLMFFFKYCVSVNKANVSTYYTIGLACFILLGLSSLSFTTYLIKNYGCIHCLRCCFIVAIILGIAMFIVSYYSVYLFIAVFGLVGLFCTIANVVLSILNAETIDYDELLCGKKRASSYAGIINPIRLFITIAGTSIPLVLMSVTGFHVSNDDHDDSTTSTKTSTMILRLWCTLFISFCMFIAFCVISFYEV